MRFLSALLALQLDSAAPPPRALPGVVYDSARGELLVFGGFLLDERPDDTLWGWDGARWRVLSRGGGPSPRGNVQMAFDAGRGRVVLHGGEIGGAMYDDTWEWDGSRWTRASEHGPGPLGHTAMAYDPLRRRTVLFGGTAGGPTRDPSKQRPSGETWEWDGRRWERRATGGPPPRNVHAMAFDARLGRVVVVGGSVRGGPTFDDMWSWDGDRWHRVDVTVPRRHSHSLVSLGDRGLLLVGGGDGADIAPAGAWRWDGRAWSAMADGGLPPLFLPGLAYDSRRDRVIVYAGIGPDGPRGDLWELDPRTSAWSRQSPAGTASRSPAPSRVRITFRPQSDSFAAAAREYDALWAAEGARIVEAMERVSGLRFDDEMGWADTAIEAVVLERASSSGYRDSPMHLRASYPPDTKRATLVHELGHRLQGGMFRRDEEEHVPLFYWIHDVWVALWGQRFADEQVEVERRRGPRYVAAWTAALALSAGQRAARWRELVAHRR